MTWWNAQNSFLLIEMLLIVVSISLLAYGYPDATRGALWEEGGIQGFNSNPQLRVYFYANYLDPPEIPFIWSRRYDNSVLIMALYQKQKKNLSSNLLPLWRTPCWHECRNTDVQILISRLPFWHSGSFLQGHLWGLWAFSTCRLNYIYTSSCSVHGPWVVPHSNHPITAMQRIQAEFLGIWLTAVIFRVRRTEQLAM